MKDFDDLFDDLMGDLFAEKTPETDSKSGGEDDDSLEDTEVGGHFDASCPYCGESVSIFLDPAGGTTQDYVEDCAVCCQPMEVRVRFSGDGESNVMIDTAY